MDIAISIIFTGLAYGMVLYIISVGLSVTMGLLGVMNLAHGAFAMAGGYLLIELMARLSLPYGLGLAAAALVVGAFSVILERTLYRRIYKRGEFDQILLSVGIIFVSTAIAHSVYGPLPRAVELPSSLLAQVSVGSRKFPAYRLFLIAFGVVTFISLWLSIERSRIGMKIRAAVDSRPMAEAVGIDTNRLFMVVFAFGSALAAAGGALGANLVPLVPGYPLEHLTYFLIVVAVGGMGSVKGPFAAALLLGLGDSACKILAPQFGAFFIYVALFAVLLVRPAGLFAGQRK
ncbi:branched-chain amino acid transport system permease protein [Tardiphaga sp. OK246]|uniref:branched-chain amino acid ABC transporter permease n=1 Tax=Tardiphaga sp. OK246 TaxID=1855307 RepID=UPI000B6ED573|nr:branched-chain amino acid ABC transporter permease [Tardiphaga sp. OK246]SNT31841.1 branched-chain amino acid transport system permease protein [Tardiphaga sp. OK246]